MEDKFQFTTLKSHQFSFYEKKNVQDSLHKWSMKDGLRLQAFAFDRPFKTYLIETFALDFLSCPAVVGSLEILNSQQRLSPIGIPASYVKMRQLKCTLKSMDVFDKLLKDEIFVWNNGQIKSCCEDFYTPWVEEAEDFGDPVEIGNELRRAFLYPDEDNPMKAFEPDLEEEFMIHMFKRLVIGGSLCQYDDSLEPYLMVTKFLYKDLVTVRQEDEKECPTIYSHVIQILQCRNEDYSKTDILFQKPQINNFLYLVVDPLQRIVKTVYHHVL